MWNGSKVFITGGSGMVARHIEFLLKNQYDVTIKSPDRNTLNLENKADVAKYIAEFQPDFVFHLAGKVHGLGGNLLYPIETLSSNIIINDSVLSACSQDCVKKIFFAGTVASYEYPYSSIPLIEEDIFKGEPHGGEYGYAMAKRLAYSYLKLLSEKFGKKFVYGVYTNLYGAHDRFNTVSGHVVPSLISKLAVAKKNQENLQVWGSPDTTRDFLHVEDAAAAAIFLMEKAEGTFNIASGVESTMQELVDALVKASDFKGDVVWDTSKPVGIPRRFSNVEKIRALGYIAENDLPTGIAKTWNWHQGALAAEEEIRS